MMSTDEQYHTCCFKIAVVVRVGNLGEFSSKNANLGIFLAFGEGIFRGILKVSYNGAFSVKYSKNMRISASQNMFRPIFQVIYHKIYTTHILLRICRIWGEFYVFLGNFRGFFSATLAVVHIEALWAMA
jgi:hypothetical protein